MTVGELLKLLMYKSSLTQNEVATLVGCTQTTISRLKNDKNTPTLKTLKKLINISKEYGISVNVNEVNIIKD